MDTLDVIRLGRPHFLIGGLLLYAYGASIAGAEALTAGLIAGYATLFFGQLSVSYSNDHFDAETDKGGQRTLFSGGSGVLQKNPGLMGFARSFALVLIGASMATAVAATAFFGLPLEYVALAAAGNLLGWYYTAPPLKLSYRRLGELATMAAAGFIMPAAGYAAASGRLDAFFLQSSIPLLLYGLVFILSVEVPDIEEDTAGGKKTWAAALGTERSFMCAAALSAAATVYYMTDPLKAGYGAIIPASLIPVGAGLLAYAKKKRMMATYVTASLIVFLASADAILLAAAAGFYPASRI